MYDICAILQFHKHVRDCSVIEDGIESDHFAVRLRIMITKIKYKARTPKPRDQAHWTKIRNDTAYSVLY